jgi:ribosome-binding factor A
MSIRTERVARLLQREIAGLLVTDFAEQLRGLVTVTGARTTKDLGIVYVYVSVLGDGEEDRQDSIGRLEDLNPRIRRVLASRIRHQLKKVPEIRFFLDDTLNQARKIEDLFSRIRVERDERGGQDERDGRDDA